MGRARSGSRRAPLRPCSWCGEPNCGECALEDEQDKVTCKNCLHELLDYNARLDDDTGQHNLES